jgi:AcrR family transcriptional regulator
MAELRPPELILRDVRRERLREAAHFEVYDRGLDHTTIGRIARRAGVDRDVALRLFPGGVEEILGLERAAV